MAAIAEIAGRPAVAAPAPLPRAVAARAWAAGPVEAATGSRVEALTAEALEAIKRGEAALAVALLRKAQAEVGGGPGVDASVAGRPEGGRAAVASLGDADAGSQAHGSARLRVALDRIAILKLLAPQLAALKGNAAPEIVEAYQLCIDLADAVDATDEVVGFDVLWGLQTCYLVRGDIREAIDIGERLLAMARRSGQSEHRLLATRILGLSRFLAGDLAVAQAHYDDVLGQYQPQHHDGLRFRYASDQRALALAHLAWVATLMANERGARRFSMLALHHSAELRHPHTSAHVACVLAAAAQTAGDRGTAGVLARTAKALSGLHRYPYWSAWADMILGWHDGSQQSGDGLSTIARAIEDYRDTGATQALPYAYLLFADVAAGGGRPATALAALAQAEVVATSRGLGVYLPEILRRQAMLQTGRGNAAATLATLDRASHLARHNGSVLFERRIADTRAALGIGAAVTGAVANAVA